MADMDLLSALQMVGTLPQAAQAAKTDIQAGLETAEEKVTDFAYAHLALSAAAVLISFSTFMVLLRRCKAEERRALNAPRTRATNGRRRRK